MTRDQKLLAKILKEAQDKLETNNSAEIISYVTLKFANKMHELNPKFNASTFVENAGLSKEQ